MPEEDEGDAAGGNASDDDVDISKVGVEEQLSSRCNADYMRDRTSSSSKRRQRAKQRLLANKPASITTSTVWPAAHK